MWIFAAVSIAMSIFGAINARNAGKKQVDLSNDMAMLADRNSVLATQELNEQVRRQGQDDQRLRASARARAAASGAEMSGSPLSYLNFMEEEQGRQLDWMKTSGASRIRLQNEGDKLRARAGVISGEAQQWDAIFTGIGSIASTVGSFGAGGAKG